MKTPLLAAFAVSLLAISGAAEKLRYCKPGISGPCIPDTEAWLDLQGRYNKIADRYQDYLKLKREEQRQLQEAISHPESLTDLASWDSMYAAVPKLDSDLRNDMADLMRDVASAYHIPVSYSEDRPIANGDYQGLSVPFEPKILLDDRYVSRKKTADGRWRTFAKDYAAQDPRAVASTLPNGDVVFRMSLLLEDYRGDVGTLASFIHHEGVHFRQLTGNGLYKREVSEVEAYKEVKKYEESVYGLPKDLRDSNARQLALNERKISDDEHAQFRWLLRTTVPWLEPPPKPDLLTDAMPTKAGWKAMEEYAARLEAPLDDVNERRKVLLKRLHYEKFVRGNYDERLKKETLERYGYHGSLPGNDGGGPGDGCATGVGGPLSPTLPCLPQPRRSPRYPAPPPPSVPTPAEPAVPSQPMRPSIPASARVDPTWALANLAVNACRNPQSVSQAYLDSSWAGIYGYAIDRNAVATYRLSGCSAQIFGELAGYGRQDGLGRLNAEWLRNRVTALLSPPPPPRPPDPVYEEPQDRRRTPTMPSPGPCLDGAATCGPRN